MRDLNRHVISRIRYFTPIEISSLAHRPSARGLVTQRPIYTSKLVLIPSPFLFAKAIYKQEQVRPTISGGWRINQEISKQWTVSLDAFQTSRIGLDYFEV